MWANSVHICIVLTLTVFVFDTGSADACGGQIRGFEGYITSPRYPENYLANTDCTWDILVPPEHYINIQFTHLEFEQGYDYVRVFGMKNSEAERELRVYSGRSTPTPSVIQSSYNHLRLVFHSDHSAEYRGFAANFSIVGDEGCCALNFLPDITTILSIANRDSIDQDERDPIEFHSRTNAVGYIFQWPDYREVEPFISKVDTISFKADNCAWEKLDMEIMASRVHEPFLVFKTIKSSIISPMYVPDASTECLNIYMYAQNSSQISVSISNSLGHETVIGVLEAQSKSTTGFTLWKLNFSIPNNYEDGYKIKMYKENDEFVGIKAVVRCSHLEGRSVHSITKDLVTDLASEAQRFAFSPFGLTLGGNGIDQCMNGGVSTDFGCACSAGFTGSNCEKGCGPNRFGRDCGGECSKLTRQCEGLLLCAPRVGCLCAPGYFGPECNQKCDNGRYGSNCSQVCGVCRESNSCNIYTGLCSEGCIDGYLPPYCKEKLVHAVNGPVLTAEEYGIISATVDLNKSSRQGEGNAIFYQIQFQKLNAEEWVIYKTKKISNEVRETIKIRGLEHGTVYSVRVIFLLETYDRYDASDVHKSDIRTKCYVPSKYNYNISANHIPDNYFTTVFSWRYDVENRWCPVNKVEISYKLGLKWITLLTSWKNNFLINNMLPNKQILFKIQAITDDQVKAPQSDVFTTTTPMEGPYKVENVTGESIGANMCALKWNVSPNVANLNYTDFKVAYKCLERTACEEDCSESKGELFTSETSIVIRGLLPTSRYQITISANEGEPIGFTVGTLSSDPSEAPLEKKDNIDSDTTHNAGNTNTSIIFYWEKGEVCSGYFSNFVYELYEANDFEKVLENGQTDLTEMAFSNLKPNTDYVLRVSIETAGGRKSKRFLPINATTDSTVPEQVRNLTVYKQGQHMLGLRWAKPRMVYGELEGFTVTYWQKNNPATKKSESIKPTACASWPSLYCHNVQGLRPGQTYNVAVSALNKNKQEPGEGSIVSGLTREKSPGAPENLKMVNVTSTTVTVQWDPPFLQNGVLRTFLVSVEEMETHNEESCCQTFPVLEKSVTEEVLHHQLEISGLSPASVYTISIAGRTNGFGPAQTLSITTRPPPLLMTLPQQLVLDCGDMTWLPQETTAHANNSVYQSLVVYRCILVLQNSTANSVVNVESGVKDERLKELLDDRLDAVYYLAAEYEEADTVNIPGEEGRFDSAWGRSRAGTLQNTTVYQLAAVQVTEYNGVLNTDILLSTPFTPC